MKKKVHGKKKAIIFFVLAVVFLSLAVGFTFFQVKECKNFECFKAEMEKCDKARYLNDGEDATWSYEVAGKKGEKCYIDVKLLQAKTGELGVEKLAGLDMKCEFNIGEVDYPEKNLDKCHGILKEEFEKIKKMHTHIVDNLGEIGEALGGNWSLR